MNVAMPPKSNVVVKDLKAEPVAVQINCPPHPWERMHLRVFDHPYFAITNENGEFEFNMVPTGPCRMVIWQESIGYLGGRTGKYGQQIDIEGAAITDLGDVELEAT